VNDGLSWANRFLTLNGAEDEPVAAADTVYVGPGIYYENLTVDVSGTSGNEITYIGDVTGENTDGVGGVVRITGAASPEQSRSRGDGISGASKDYRIFRGFQIDVCLQGIDIDNCDNWTIEDCVIWLCQYPIRNLSGGTNTTIRRCILSGRTSLYFNSATVVDNAGHVVENCLLFGNGDIRIDRIGGWTIRNCTFVGLVTAIRVYSALTVGQTIAVNNCIITQCTTGLRGTIAGEIVEDYNTFYENGTDRTNVNVGGNSVAYPPGFLAPILFSGASQVSGYKVPWWFGTLGSWSAVAALAGTGEPTEDMLGIVRPTTAAKNSWGAVQFHDAERETGTVQAGSVSIVLHDAGVHQMWVPVTAVSTTISVYVYREADYTGTNPRMVIKQPGQADDTTTDAAAASQWNELTTTLTPAATPPYVVVELQSLNTAAATNFDVFFDTLTVS
jgi:hypothetical protein